MNNSIEYDKFCDASAKCNVAHGEAVSFGRGGGGNNSSPHSIPKRRALDEKISSKIANMGIFCAILVVFIHINPRPSELGSAAWLFHYIIRYAFATIGVPFFFVVSGFFLARHCEEAGWYKSALKKRLKSLVVPFIFWSIFLTVYTNVLLFLSNSRHGQEQTIISAVSSVEFWLHTVGILSPHRNIMYLWYVRSLFMLVLASPLLVYLLRKRALVAMSVLFFAYYIINPGQIDYPDWWICQKWQEFWRWEQFTLEGTFYFSLGICLNYHQFTIKRSDGIALGVLGVAIAIVRMLFNLTGHLEPVPLVALHIPFVMIGVWTLIPSKMWSKWLVKSSFPLYIMHPLFLSIYGVLYKRLTGTYNNETIFNLLAIWLFAIATSIGLSFLLHKLTPKFANTIFGGR